MLTIFILATLLSFSSAQRQSVALVIGGYNPIGEGNRYLSQVDLFGCNDETVQVDDFPFKGNLSLA